MLYGCGDKDTSNNSLAVPHTNGSQSVVPGLAALKSLGTCYKCRFSGPGPDLLNKGKEGARTDEVPEAPTSKGVKLSHK